MLQTDRTPKRDPFPGTVWPAAQTEDLTNCCNQTAGSFRPLLRVSTICGAPSNANNILWADRSHPECSFSYQNGRTHRLRHGRGALTQTGVSPQPDQDLHLALALALPARRD